MMHRPKSAKAYRGGAWTKAWLEPLKACCPQDRIKKARSYVIIGAVVEVAVEPGVLRGQVQGTKSTLHEVEIRCRPLDAAKLARMRKSRGDLDIPTGALLETLCPGGADLRGTCDCPDWAPICEHTAALYLAFLEVARQRPSDVLLLRGYEFDAGEDAPTDSTPTPAGMPSATAETKPGPAGMPATSVVSDSSPTRMPAASVETEHAPAWMPSAAAETAPAPAGMPSASAESKSAPLAPPRTEGPRPTRSDWSALGASPLAAPRRRRKTRPEATEELLLPFDQVPAVQAPSLPPPPVERQGPPPCDVGEVGPPAPGPVARIHEAGEVDTPAPAPGTVARVHEVGEVDTPALRPEPTAPAALPHEDAGPASVRPPTQALLREPAPRDPRPAPRPEATPRPARPGLDRFWRGEPLPEEADADAPPVCVNVLEQLGAPPWATWEAAQEVLAPLWSHLATHAAGLRAQAGRVKNTLEDRLSRNHKHAAPWTAEIR